MSTISLLLLRQTCSSFFTFHFAFFRAWSAHLAFVAFVVVVAVKMKNWNIAQVLNDRLGFFPLIFPRWQNREGNLWERMVPASLNCRRPCYPNLIEFYLNLSLSVEVSVFRKREKLVRIVLEKRHFAKVGFLQLDVHTCLKKFTVREFQAKPIQSSYNFAAVFSRVFHPLHWTSANVVICQSYRTLFIFQFSTVAGNKNESWNQL